MKRYRSSSKSKSGVTTAIGGTLVFMIIISVITPVFFYMSLMNNMYDRTISEMKDFDRQRNVEDLTTSIWPTSVGNVRINIRNNGPYAVDVNRVWVVPSNDIDPYWIAEPRHIKPDGIEAIDSTTINDYIQSLEGASYYIKLTTEKGNMFYVSPLTQEISGGLYRLPLLITRSSQIRKGGKGGDYNWYVTLQVYNQETVEYKVNYVLISAQYDSAGGKKSEVDLKEVNFLFPPQKFVAAKTFGFDVSKQSNVILVELVGDVGYTLGLFYFIIEDIEPPPPILPDLTVYSHDITWMNPNYLNAKIRNIGDNNANNVLVHFYNGDPYDGGTLLGTDNLGFIGPGAFTMASIDWGPSGTYQIYVIVDPDDTIDEWVETNNKAGNEIIIP